MSKLAQCKACIDNFCPHQNDVKLDSERKMSWYLLSQNTDKHMSNSMSFVLFFGFHILMNLRYKSCANVSGSESVHENVNIY